MSFPPLPPPFDGAPELIDDSGQIRAWITEPPGLVHQLAENSCYSEVLVDWLLDAPTRALRAHGSATGQERYRFVHDWRGVSSHESATRRKLVSWGLSFPRGQIERIDAILPDDISAVMSMAVSAGRMAMTVAGITMETADAPAGALRGLQPRRAKHR